MQSLWDFYFADGFNRDLHIPCVTFVGHPSLRFGDVVHLLELWGKSSANTIIFTGKKLLIK